MVLLAAPTARTRLSIERLHAHVISHRHLLLARKILELPVNMIRTTNRRAAALGITARTAKCSREFAAAATGVHARAAVGAAVVASGVGRDGDCPLGAELGVGFGVEFDAVHFLALRVDVVEDFAHDFLAFAAVEVVEGEAGVGVAA